MDERAEIGGGGGGQAGSQGSEWQCSAQSIRKRSSWLPKAAQGGTSTHALRPDPWILILLLPLARSLRLHKSAERTVPSWSAQIRALEASTQRSVSTAVHLTPSSELRRDFRVAGHACTDDREVTVARSRLQMRQEHNRQIWTALRTRQRTPSSVGFCAMAMPCDGIPGPIMLCFSHFSY